MSIAAMAGPAVEASAGVRGIVGIGAQTFGGAKTFNGTIISGVAAAGVGVQIPSGTLLRLGSGLEYLTGVGDGSGIKVAGYQWMVGSGAVYFDSGGSKKAQWDGTSINFNSDVSVGVGIYFSLGGQIFCGQVNNTGLIVSQSGALQELTGQVADGAGATAVAIGPFAGSPWTQGKVVSFRNQRGGTEKIAIDSHGKLIAPTGQADSVAGVATLVGGTVTVNTTSVKTGSVLLYARKTTGGTVGQLSVTTVDSTSFTINSSSGTETSTVSWFLIN